MWRLFALGLMLASPVRADVAEAVRGHILPGYAAFAQATAALDAAAQADCGAGGLRPAYQAAFDAWMGVSHLRLGPVEDQGRALAIAFWPDPKGLGAKQQAALIRAQDAVVADAAAFAEVSVAARGLMALERLLYPAEPLAGAYPCALIRATTRDLAAIAAAVDAEWQQGFAASLLAPGAANARFLSQAEVRQALLTLLITGLEFTADQRLGRPLGSFDKPRPERAEARASGRGLRNVAQSLAALEGLARQLTAELGPGSPQTWAAFARARGLAAGLDDPVLAGVADPGGRLKIEILQQAIHATRDAALAEIGAALGVGLGFNAADGD